MNLLLRAFFLVLPAYFFLVSCETEEIPEDGELMITIGKPDHFPDEKQITALKLSLEDEPVIYPNPFKTGCYLLIPEYTGRQIKIIVSDDDGKFKVVYNEVNTGEEITHLNFSKVPEGNYICDVLVDEVVFRFELLKIE